MKFIFDYYLNKTWPEVLDAKTAPQDALNIMIDYYKTVSNNIGNRTHPREQLFQILDDTFNRRKQLEKAKVFADYYSTCYPQSSEAKKLVEKYKIK